MVWKNYGLMKYKDISTEKFTTNLGMKIRRGINRPLRYILRKGTPCKIVVENYPALNKKESYIFAPTHGYLEEVSAVLGTIDRSAYALMGNTDQLEHNPLAYFQWLLGMIYVDRENSKSRKDSILKMVRVLQKGSSILIFPEGGWNNTENLLVENLFPGVYNISNISKKQVVPVSVYRDDEKNILYLNYGLPLDLYNMEKNEALQKLRDTLATLKYEQICKYSKPLERSKLVGDIRYDYMIERKNEYDKIKWTKDVFDEELTVYKKNDTFDDVWNFVDNIELTKSNSEILAPVRVRRMEEKRYDLKNYLHETWKK